MNTFNMTEESKFILEFFQKINLEKIKELRKSISDSYFNDFNDESFDLITSYSTNGISDNAAAYEISTDKIKNSSISVNLEYAKIELSTEFEYDLEKKVFFEMLIDYKNVFFTTYVNDIKYKYNLENGEIEIIINKDNKIIDKLVNITNEQRELLNIQYDLNIENALDILNSLDFVKETAKLKSKNISSLNNTIKKQI